LRHRHHHLSPYGYGVLPRGPVTELLRSKALASAAVMDTKQAVARARLKIVFIGNLLKGLSR
jgi:hypothetical protein